MKGDQAVKKRIKSMHSHFSRWRLSRGHVGRTIRFISYEGSFKATDAHYFFAIQ